MPGLISDSNAAIMHVLTGPGTLEVETSGYMVIRKPANPAWLYTSK
jgi:hypothetical protein